MKEKSRMFQDKLRKGDEPLILPIIAYYGTGRLWDNHRAKRENLNDNNIKSAKNTRKNGYIDCIDGTANLKLMNEWFRNQTILKYQYQELGKGKVYVLEAVYSAMGRYFSEVTGYTDVKIQYSMPDLELFVNYTNENKVTRLPLRLLSAGYKGTLSLIADIAYRMAMLNPYLKENVLTKTTGIIFIDKIDELRATSDKEVSGCRVKLKLERIRKGVNE